LKFYTALNQKINIFKLIPKLYLYNALSTSKKYFTPIFISYKLTLITIFLFPVSAVSQPLSFKTWINTETQEAFYKNMNQNNTLSDSIGIQVSKNSSKISSNVTVNFTKNQNVSFDQSFLEYKTKNSTIGIGKINRNWSFSPNTSLILSKNARPPVSLYFSIQKNQKSINKKKLWSMPWSFDAFNAITSNSTAPNDTMLLGMRLIFEPVNNLKFELLKTSQWGGDGYDEDPTSFLAAVVANTNEKKHSTINQLAGFGFSYLRNSDKLPIKIYAQFIGEDEAGNLPSCYMTLIGSSVEFPTSLINTKFGVEYVDTRIGKTTHGFCGPNTAYNNTTYKYTNYDTVLGAPIDTEGKSIKIWVGAELLKRTNVNLYIEDLKINNQNLNNHRLSSTKKDGLTTGIETSWVTKKFSISNRINYQDISLDNAGLKKGLSIRFHAKYTF